MDEKDKKVIDKCAGQQYVSDYRSVFKILKSKKEPVPNDFPETGVRLPMPDIEEIKEAGSGYWLYYYSLNEENNMLLKAHFDSGLLSCYGHGINSLRHTLNKKSVLHALFNGESPDFDRLRNKIYPWAVQHIWEILNDYFTIHKKEIPEKEFEYFKSKEQDAKETVYLKELNGLLLIKPSNNISSAKKGRTNSKNELAKKSAEIDNLKQQVESLKAEKENLSAKNKELIKQKEQIEKEYTDELARMRALCKKTREDAANDKIKSDAALINIKEQTVMQIINALKDPIYSWEQALSGDDAPSKFTRLNNILMALSEIGIEPIVALSDLIKMRPLHFEESKHYDSCSVHENGQPVYAITLGFQLSNENIFGLNKKLIDKAEVRSVQLNNECEKDKQ